MAAVLVPIYIDHLGGQLTDESYILIKCKKYLEDSAFDGTDILNQMLKCK